MLTSCHFILRCFLKNKFPSLNILVCHVHFLFDIFRKTFFIFRIALFVSGFPRLFLLLSHYNFLIDISGFSEFPLILIFLLENRYNQSKSLRTRWIFQDLFIHNRNNRLIIRKFCGSSCHLHQTPAARNCESLSGEFSDCRHTDLCMLHVGTSRQSSHSSSLRTWSSGL